MTTDTAALTESKIPARDLSLKPRLGGLVVSYFVITAWNIQIQSIAAPDEPRYAAAARDMIRTGDWVIPYFNGKERLVKPIFFYWLIAGLGAAGKSVGIPL